VNSRGDRLTRLGFTEDIDAIENARILIHNPGFELFNCHFLIHIDVRVDVCVDAHVHVHDRDIRLFL